MRKNVLLLSAALSAVLLQTGCVSSRKTIPGATIARSDFRIRDPFVLAENGGHGMIFKTFDGRLMLTLHQPNTTPDERMRLFELHDDGGALRAASRESR